jgi:hypothetical protein
MLFGLVDHLNNFRFLIFTKLLTTHENWVKRSLNRARIYELKL